MKKKFKLQDLDCANCAAKMEDAIKKIDGVQDATVSFMTQKMTIEADDARFDDIMKEVVSVCKKVEKSIIPYYCNGSVVCGAAGNGAYCEGFLYGAAVCGAGIISDSVFCNRLGHYVQSCEKYITRTGI